MPTDLNPRVLYWPEDCALIGSTLQRLWPQLQQTQYGGGANMNHSAHHLFMLDVTFVLVVLLLLTVVVAVGSNVLHRSVALEREIATRRVLGARRYDIARTFLLESMGPLLLGSCRFAARSSTPLVFQRTAPRRGPAHWRSRRGTLRNSRGAPRGAACIACCLWKERAVRRRLGQTRRVTT